MSSKGDFKKIQRRAEDQGWRVEKAQRATDLIAA